MSDIVDLLRDGNFYFDVRDMAAGEIERLRGELAAALKNEVHYAKRIEELEDGAPCLRRFIELQDALLERAPEFGIHSGWSSLIPHIVRRIITDDQIDAAWNGLQFIYSLEVREEVERFILKPLGIVRCGGCNGSGSAVHDDPECGIHEFECPTCNGHGWVKEADDETR